MVSKAAVDEAAKRAAARRASLGPVNIRKCQIIAIRIGGERASADSRPSQKNTTLLPRYKLDEINAGRVLKRGSFSTISFATIREVRSIVAADSSNDDDDEPDHQLAQDKKLLSDSLIMEGSKDARYGYAMKVGTYISVFVLSMRARCSHPPRA